jgi:hypothetical protein
MIRTTRCVRGSAIAPTSQEPAGRLGSRLSGSNATWQRVGKRPDRGSCGSDRSGHKERAFPCKPNVEFLQSSLHRNKRPAQRRSCSRRWITFPLTGWITLAAFSPLPRSRKVKECHVSEAPSGQLLPHVE